MQSRARQCYQFGNFRLDAGDRLLYRDERVVPLPPKVYDTLLLLVVNSGRVVSRSELIERLWPDTFVEEGTLTQYISLLRKALGESAAWIENHPRRGYRFTAPVRESPNGAWQPRTEEQETVAGRRRRNRFTIVVATLALLGVAAAASLIWISRSESAPGSFGSAAVLPFRAVSNPGNDYLADGITEALITKLCNLKGLRVVSYSRVRRFRGSALEAAEIGRQLGVEAVIEGTVRAASGRIRLSVHAVNAKTGYTVWAIDRLESDSMSVLDIQNELAEATALRFRGRLTESEQGAIAKSATGNAQAYDLVLRARGMLSRGTTGSAVQMLERAVRLDPGYAEASGWLAFAQHTAYQNGLAGPEALRAAISNANQALSRNPNALIAMRALAHIQHSTGREVEGLLMARRALETSPDDLDAIAAAAEAYFRTGLYHRAVPLYEKALVGEPGSRQFRSQLARMHLFLGEYQKGIDAISPLPPSQVGPFGMLLFAETGQMGKAIEALRSGLKRRPDDHLGPYFGGCMLAAAGDLKGANEVWMQAARRMETQLAKHENPYARAFLARIYARLGMKEQARYHLDRSLATDPRHPVFLFFASATRALLGERHQALETLKAAVENGFFNLPMIEFLSRPSLCLHSVRDEPEFRGLRADLARRVEELRARY